VGSQVFYLQERAGSGACKSTTANTIATAADDISHGIGYRTTCIIHARSLGIVYNGYFTLYIRGLRIDTVLYDCDGFHDSGIGVHFNYVYRRVL
jgi:hypothetical protein